VTLRRSQHRYETQTGTSEPCRRFLANTENRLNQDAGRAILHNGDRYWRESERNAVDDNARRDTANDHRDIRPNSPASCRRRLPGGSQALALGRGARYKREPPVTIGTRSNRADWASCGGQLQACRKWRSEGWLSFGSRAQAYRTMLKPPCGFCQHSTANMRARRGEASQAGRANGLAASTTGPSRVICPHDGLSATSLHL